MDQLDRDKCESENSNKTKLRPVGQDLWAVIGVFQHFCFQVTFHVNLGPVESEQMADDNEHISRRKPLARNPPILAGWTTLTGQTKKRRAPAVAPSAELDRLASHRASGAHSSHQGTGRRFERRFNPDSNSGGGSEGGEGRISTSRTWVQLLLSRLLLLVPLRICIPTSITTICK